jgi:hypothetical protein
VGPVGPPPPPPPPPPPTPLVLAKCIEGEELQQFRVDPLRGQILVAAAAAAAGVSGLTMPAGVDPGGNGGGSPAGAGDFAPVVRRPRRPCWRPFWLRFTYVASVLAQKY